MTARAAKTRLLRPSALAGVDTISSEAGPAGARPFASRQAETLAGLQGTSATLPSCCRPVRASARRETPASSLAEAVRACRQRGRAAADPVACLCRAVGHAARIGATSVAIVLPRRERHHALSAGAGGGGDVGRRRRLGMAGGRLRVPAAPHASPGRWCCRSRCRPISRPTPSASSSTIPGRCRASSARCSASRPSATTGSPTYARPAAAPSCCRRCSIPTSISPPASSS